VSRDEDAVTATIHKWLGRLVVLGIPIVVAGVISAWLDIRDLSGAMDRAEKRISILEDFRRAGKRFTYEDGQRHTNRFNAVESDIAALDNRLDRIHDAQQEHKVSAAGWTALTKQNERDIKAIRSGR
jgi:hypothetical protein